MYAVTFVAIVSLPVFEIYRIHKGPRRSRRLPFRRRPIRRVFRPIRRVRLPIRRVSRTIRRVGRPIHRVGRLVGRRVRLTRFRRPYRFRKPTFLRFRSGRGRALRLS